MPLVVDLDLLRTMGIMFRYRVEAVKVTVPKRSGTQLRIPAESDQHSWVKPITIPVDADHDSWAKAIIIPG
jgi:hypothetical protein